MKQRKDIEHQIEVCEKKKLWIEYQDLREKVIECTNDKKEALKLVQSHKSKMEPLEKVIEGAKKGISKLEQQKLSAVSISRFYLFNCQLIDNKYNTYIHTTHSLSLKG
jgi:chromosome segregation ATPase